MERGNDEFGGFQFRNVGEKGRFPGGFRGGDRVVMGGGRHGAEKSGETGEGPESYVWY